MMTARSRPGQPLWEALGRLRPTAAAGWVPARALGHPGEGSHLGPGPAVSVQPRSRAAWLPGTCQRLGCGTRAPTPTSLLHHSAPKYLSIPSSPPPPPPPPPCRAWPLPFSPPGPRGPTSGLCHRPLVRTGQVPPQPCFLPPTPACEHCGGPPSRPAGTCALRHRDAVWGPGRLSRIAIPQAWTRGPHRRGARGADSPGARMRHSQSLD